MRVIIDTCIIIDALQSRPPFAFDAQNIFNAAALHKFAGCLTAKSIADIYYITHKQTHSDIQTRQILQSLFALFEIVDTRATYCITAVSSAISDYEDAIMDETAIFENVDYIVTRNVKDYSNSKIPVLLPNDFLKLL